MKKPGSVAGGESHSLVLTCVLSGPPCRGDKGTKSKRRTAAGPNPSRRTMCHGKCPAVSGESWSRQLMKGVTEAEPCRGVPGSKVGGSGWGESVPRVFHW